MSRRAVEAVLSLRERHRFMKGLFAWVGFPGKSVFYDRAPRLAGRSQWNWWRLWNLAIEGITSFTVLPLKLATYLGLAVATIAIAYAGLIVLRTLLHGNPVAGYPSLMAVMLFLGGTQLVTLGIIGEYLGRVFNESKARPLYIVERFMPSSPSVAIRAASASRASVGGMTSQSRRERTGPPLPQFAGEANEPPRIF